MWIHVGRLYFNTDNLTYVQVEMNDFGDAPHKVHLHFINERDNFALHNAEAAKFLACLGTISSSDPNMAPLLEQKVAIRSG